MGLVINNNVTALNAWRNLSTSNSRLSRSLEKLSSGLQINRGSDNPAGLVISEKLRAQATGLDQAVKNTLDAVSVIQVAEGALQEVHSILNSVRALAIHAANEGANDADSISADQSQVDNAIDAISRIANTTKFLGKFLLNGGAGNTTILNAEDNVTSLTLDTALTTGYLSYNITTAASRASYSTLGADWSASFAIAANDTLTINGIGIALSQGDTRASVITAINTRSADTGVHVSGQTDEVGFYANQFGSQYDINVSWAVSGTMGANTVVAGGVYTVGSDIEGTIGGSGATGNGLTLTATGTNWSGTAVTFTAAGNTTNNSLARSTDMSVTKSNLKFNIGGNAAATEIISFSISDMRAESLGSTSNGFLKNTTNGIYTGNGNALATNAAGAVQIIDDAIQSVSDERAKLGAYQKNSIETMNNSLSAALENIRASESRIRDLDMAKEMMEFTKYQILQQAGTAMLAQANQIPQAALTLLQ